MLDTLQADTSQCFLALQTFSGGAAVSSPAVSYASCNGTSGPASAVAAFTMPSAARVASFALLLLLVYVFYEQVKFYLYR